MNFEKLQGFLVKKTLKYILQVVHDRKNFFFFFMSWFPNVEGLYYGRAGKPTLILKVIMS